MKNLGAGTMCKAITVILRERWDASFSVRSDWHNLGSEFVYLKYQTDFQLACATQLLLVEEVNS